MKQKKQYWVHFSGAVLITATSEENVPDIFYNKSMDDCNYLKIDNIEQVYKKEKYNIISVY